MEDITAKELKEKIAKNGIVNILDVREEWEYKQENIGALNIPLASLPHRIDEIEQYKNEELIVHCKSGGRSATAKKYLESRGFLKVRNLLKGIEGFKA